MKIEDPAPRGAEVVAAHLAARGGKERIQAFDSIRETGTATASGGRVARVVREIERPGMFRLEFSVQGTTAIFANDGSTGWQVAPLQGQFEPQAVPPEADAAAGVDQRDIEGPLVGWREKGPLVVRCDFTRIIRGHPVELENTFCDFREVGGLVFPHQVETRAKDRPNVVTIEVETIELDPELDDAAFRLPG